MEGRRSLGRCAYPTTFHDYEKTWLLATSGRAADAKKLVEDEKILSAFKVSCEELSVHHA